MGREVLDPRLRWRPMSALTGGAGGGEPQAEEQETRCFTVKTKSAPVVHRGLRVRGRFEGQERAAHTLLFRAMHRNPGRVHARSHA